MRLTLDRTVPFPSDSVFAWWTDFQEDDHGSADSPARSTRLILRRRGNEIWLRDEATRPVRVTVEEHVTSIHRTATRSTPTIRARTFGTSTGSSRSTAARGSPSTRGSARAAWAGSSCHSPPGGGVGMRRGTSTTTSRAWPTTCADESRHRLRLTRSALSPTSPPPLHLYRHRHRIAGRISSPSSRRPSLLQRLASRPVRRSSPPCPPSIGSSGRSSRARSR